MASPAQLDANQMNAQLSTGPKTDEGKAASSQNNFRTGLAGAFVLLDSESPAEFAELHSQLTNEHKPSTPTETMLIQRMAEHFWLTGRALSLQNTCFDLATGLPDDKRFALYLRYQTSHERAFHKCLADLLRLRAERRRTEIGFESQNAKAVAEARTAELHQARIRNLNARSADLELDFDIRETVEAPLPGNYKFSFNHLKQVLSEALVQTARELNADPDLAHAVASSFKHLAA